MEQKVDQLTKERNHFAQKLVAAQSNMDQSTPGKATFTIERTPDNQTNIVSP
jgi:hypothetical protein